MAEKCFLMPTRSGAVLIKNYGTKKKLEKAVSRLMARHREEDAEGAASPRLVEDSAA